MRGHYSEGRRWLDEALATDGRGSPEVRAMALAGAAGLATEQGDVDRVKEVCEEGLELLVHEASEAKLLLLTWVGWVALQREEHEQAQQLFEERMALGRKMRDTYWLATSLIGLALVSYYRGDLEKATELFEESMDLLREQGEKHSLSYCLNNLGIVVYSQGDLERASQLTEEAVALFRDLRARGDVAEGLGNLGWIALLQDDLGRAANLYGESLTLSWDTGSPVRLGGISLLGCSTGRRAAGGAALGSSANLTRSEGYSQRRRLLRRGRRSYFRCALGHGRRMGEGVAQGSGDEPR
jgi:tetratricopeptide (TPR) repeat protein